MCSVSFLSSNQTYKSLSRNFKFHQGKFHFFSSRQLTSSSCHLHTYKWLLSPTGSLAYCTQQLFPTQLLLCLAWLWGRWKLSLRAVFQKARRKKNHKALIKPWRHLEILLSSFSFLVETLTTREWLSQHLQILEPMIQIAISQKVFMHCTILSAKLVPPLTHVYSYQVLETHVNVCIDVERAVSISLGLSGCDYKLSGWLTVFSRFGWWA